MHDAPSNPTPSRRVQIFSEGDFLSGTLTWGWQCLDCGADEVGLSCATTARELADEHTESRCEVHRDWCLHEEAVTDWDGEVCRSCGRVWGESE